MKKFAQKNKGFTLIETLVAITILMLAISGPLVFVSGALGEAIYARDQVTAFYLAQDAIEQIRNIRDTNEIQIQTGINEPSGSPAGPWLSNLAGVDGTLDLSPCLDQNGCIISALNAGASTIQTCPSNGCPALSYDPTTFVYGYTQDEISGGKNYLANGTPSIYTRTVHITQLGADEAKVSVRIDWQTQFSARSFTVVEDIFNWVSSS